MTQQSPQSSDTIEFAEVKANDQARQTVPHIASDAMNVTIGDESSGQNEKHGQEKDTQPAAVQS